MKKYIPVFGPQELFDDAPDDACFVVVFRDSMQFCAGNKDSQLDAFLLNVGGHVAAERRIIEEPKRWTVEDQKAGRLPEVGAEYDVDGCIVEHLGNGAAGYQNVFYFKYPSGACGNAHERLAKPIETPDVKAIRLEGEFVRSFLSNDLNYERGLRDAYRRLSGELPPVQAKEETK